MPAVRTFLVGRTQDRGELLARQVPVAAALFESDEPIDCLRVFDSADSVNCRQLGERLGTEVGGVDLAESVAAGAEMLADCDDTVEFAIASGAALAHLEKGRRANFRDDFMPYQGKKVRLQKTLKFLSVSVSILMLALGMYVSSQLWRTNRSRGLIRNEFEPQYSAVMSGKKPPGGIYAGLKKLDSVSRRLKAVGKPSIDDQALSAKLRLVLEAFNYQKCAAKTKLQIDTITISAQTIRVKGSTSGRRGTTRLRKAITAVGLKIVTDNVRNVKGRDSVVLTLAPASKKSS